MLNRTLHQHRIVKRQECCEKQDLEELGIQRNPQSTEWIRVVLPVYLGPLRRVFLQGSPEHDIALPDPIDNVLNGLLTQKSLRFRDRSDFQSIQSGKDRREMSVLCVIALSRVFVVE